VEVKIYNRLTHRTSSVSLTGWAMRAALAAALFVTPDLLLLDEVRFATSTAGIFCALCLLILD
jgi:ABC-type uncharacterized transport system ATPase subunit